ncbi:hypothetical protein C476_17177 [Natrinema limicola JCM 13563]|uniref:Uncharacterized protein n=1 Tax=Natrinema limicola JCM 13563 TaxID=1230457 RepID=M0BY60_9EURY|nr:hypothetical protein C476_17177 [Natrinema limicola JCM 13563]
MLSGVEIVRDVIFRDTALFERAGVVVKLEATAAVLASREFWLQEAEDLVTSSEPADGAVTRRRPASLAPWISDTWIYCWGELY